LNCAGVICVRDRRVGDGLLRRLPDVACWTRKTLAWEFACTRRTGTRVSARHTHRRAARAAHTTQEGSAVSHISRGV